MSQGGADCCSLGLTVGKIALGGREAKDGRSSNLKQTCLENWLYFYSDWMRIVPIIEL